MEIKWIFDSSNYGIFYETLKLSPRISSKKRSQFSKTQNILNNPESCRRESSPSNLDPVLSSKLAVNLKDSSKFLSSKEVSENRKES